MMNFITGNMRYSTLIITIFLFNLYLLVAQTVVYPAPAGATASTQYTVKVNNQSSFVFQSSYVIGVGDTRGAFTSFSTAQTVPVTVTTNVDISAVTIRPLRLGITYTKTAARTITFNVPSDCNLSVEINGNVATPLYIFSNPLEVDVPSPSDPNVKYYAAGQIYMENITPKAGQTIYIAGGAIVRGNITCNGVSNFTVRGRGIIDSSVNTTNSRTVRVVGGSNIAFEGVVFHSVQGWGMVFGTCNGLSVNNIKVISTPDGESDALDIVGCQNVTVNKGFFRSEDDCICIKSTKEGYNLGVGNPQTIAVSGAVVFNGHRGNALEIGYELNGIVDANGQSIVTDIHFSDIDIIHKGTAIDGSTNRRSAMSIHNDENARVSNVTYENIRIEDCEENYVYMGVLKTSGAIDLVNRGSIDTVFFKNIQVVGGDLTLPSAIYGYDATHQVTNITFDNFKIGNTLVTSNSTLKLTTNSYVKNIFYKNTITHLDSSLSSLIKVYPTLCLDRIYIESKETLSYSILDRLGREQASGTIATPFLPISFLVSGLYLLQLKGNTTNVIHKFFKK